MAFVGAAGKTGASNSACGPTIFCVSAGAIGAAGRNAADKNGLESQPKVIRGYFRDPWLHSLYFSHSALTGSGIRIFIRRFIRSAASAAPSPSSQVNVRSVAIPPDAPAESVSRIGRLPKCNSAGAENCAAANSFALPFLPAAIAKQPAPSRAAPRPPAPYASRATARQSCACQKRLAFLALFHHHAIRMQGDAPNLRIPTREIPAPSLRIFSSPARTDGFR